MAGRQRRGAARDHISRVLKIPSSRNMDLSSLNYKLTMRYRNYNLTEIIIEKLPKPRSRGNDRCIEAEPSNTAISRTIKSVYSFQIRIRLSQRFLFSSRCCTRIQSAHPFLNGAPFNHARSVLLLHPPRLSDRRAVLLFQNCFDLQTIDGDGFPCTPSGREPL